MWGDLLEAMFAVLAFISFPFLVIAAAAVGLRMWDRLSHVSFRH